jgi:hypothetical protein
MSKQNRITNEEDQEESRGPNLVLVYSLVALGLLIAIAFAALIVWPFYKAR